MKENIKVLNLIKSPCVYFLYSYEDELLYVGVTVDIFSRISIHRKNIDFEVVKYIEYRNIQEASGAEKKFIFKYRPPFNKMIPAKIRSVAESAPWIPSRKLISMERNMRYKNF